MAIIRTSKPLRLRSPHDHYKTPEPLVYKALGLLDGQDGGDFPSLKIGPPSVIWDPGAGTGVWGKEAHRRWPEAALVGFETDRAHRRPRAYGQWLTDFLDTGANEQLSPPDLVIGNPPYDLAEEFIREALWHLKSGGWLLFLLRLSFLESHRRAADLWRTYRPVRVWVLAERISFYGNGKTDDTAYMLALWRQGLNKRTDLDWLSWR